MFLARRRESGAMSLEATPARAGPARTVSRRPPTRPAHGNARGKEPLD